MDAVQRQVRGWHRWTLPTHTAVDDCVGTRRDHSNLTTPPPPHLLTCAHRTNCSPKKHPRASRRVTIVQNCTQYVLNKLRVIMITQHGPAVCTAPLKRAGVKGVDNQAVLSLKWVISYDAATRLRRVRSAFEKGWGERIRQPGRPFTNWVLGIPRHVTSRRGRRPGRPFSIQRPRCLSPATHAVQEVASSLWNFLSRDVRA
jgi:hypothetical protein